MNKQRRKEIFKMINELEKIKDELKRISCDEQYYFDNMPENLQGSLRGIDSEEAIERLDDAVGSVMDAIENLEEI